jgi:MOSC domain-containing protein YiiM
MANLVSMHVAMPKDVAWNGRTVHTGAWKSPWTGPKATPAQFDGDGQGDLDGHGGEDRAVLVYQLDSYQHWLTELRRDHLQPGLFGDISRGADLIEFW